MCIVSLVPYILCVEWLGFVCVCVCLCPLGQSFFNIILTHRTKPIPKTNVMRSYGGLVCQRLSFLFIQNRSHHRLHFLPSFLSTPTYTPNSYSLFYFSSYSQYFSSISRIYALGYQIITTTNYTPHNATPGLN